MTTARVHTTIRFPLDLWLRVALLAKYKDRSASSLAIELIFEGVERLEKKLKKAVDE